MTMVNQVEIGNIYSYNCRGLRLNPKRKKVFKWLHRRYRGIVMLQETHTNKRTMGGWDFDLGSKHHSYFSHSKDRTKKGGVCTYIPKRIKKYVIDDIRDEEGRLLIIKLVIHNIKYAIVNVYFPTQDHVKEQELFIEKLATKLDNLEDHILIIGGDFNIALNPILDRWNPKNPEPSKTAKQLKGLMQKFNLIDYWRIKNPELVRFTWRRTEPVLQQSRIDMFLVSDIITPKINYINIEMSYISDHTLISMHINPFVKDNRGPSYWKFNESLLNNEDYTKIVKETIKAHNRNNDKKKHSATLNWDVLKMQIRRETINFSKRLAKKRRKREKELLENIKLLEEEISSNVNCDESTIEAFQNIKNEYEEMESQKTRGAMIRSKARWVEDGEKNSKYFMSLEKHNQEIRYIKTLTKENGKEISKDKKILDYIKEYYTKIYSLNSDVSHETEDLNYFQSEKKLSKDDKNHLDSPFTEEEISEAVKELPRGKTPGLDGFTVEFYKFFWNDLKEAFMYMLTDVYINEHLSIDQKRGVITLIPKQDKDLKKIGNWRPISILNTDYKIITKGLANRLKKVLPDIINEDQNGFVLGRLIGQNVRIVKDLMDYCQTTDIKGLLVMLDFEKAFDSLSWSFITHTLKQFNFGPNYIRWVSLLYRDISSSVINNGNISDKFDLKRGIRQGCPLSAFIFILCAELLANKIREKADIEGLSIGNYEYKILQFADDTALMVKNVNSLKECLKVLDIYYKCSGLKLNKSKTVVVTLGNGDNDNQINNLLRELNLSICNDTFRYLGIWFDKDELVMEFKNFRHRLDNIINLLKIWLQRDLSLKGKVTVLKTLAMSQLIFPLSMLSAPKWVIDEADSLFLQFLWDTKPRKVKKLTTEQRIADGGLGMLNVDYMAQALKASWVKIIFSEEDNKWTNIPKRYFNDYHFNDFCMTRFDRRVLPYYLPDFYRQCLVIIDDLKTNEPESKEEIKNEMLWLNRHITVNNVPLFYENWYNLGIKKIEDLIDQKGEFLLPEDLEKKFSLGSTPFLEYYSLRQAIPHDWKVILKNSNIIDNEFEIGQINIHIEDRLVNIKHCTNKILYWQILSNNNKSIPITRHYWMNRYMLNDTEMSKIYCLPYRNVRDVKIQSLQYKILNHIYACRLKLKHWRLEPSDHHFFDCNEVSIFWNSLNNWWLNFCTKCNLRERGNVLLGHYNKCCHQYQLNYIGLKAKWYVSKRKYWGHNFSFLEFLPELKRELIIEEMICRKKEELDKFIDNWYYIINEI
jgi:exonuclease III